MVMDSRGSQYFWVTCQSLAVEYACYNPLTDRRNDLTRLGQCPNGRIGWRWLVWHRFSHKNRTQLPSRMRLHDSKRRVRASGIFDSHRPLHFPSSLANDSQLDFQLTTGGTLVGVGARWPWFHTQSCPSDRVRPTAVYWMAARPAPLGGRR